MLPPARRGGHPLTRWPRTVAEWRTLDHRVKARVSRRLTIPPRGPIASAHEERAFTAWVAWQAFLALAIPFLLTPLLMWLLFPRLPLRHPEAYVLPGIAGLLASCLARKNDAKET